MNKVQITVNGSANVAYRNVISCRAAGTGREICGKQIKPGGGITIKRPLLWITGAYMYLERSLLTGPVKWRNMEEGYGVRQSLSDGVNTGSRHSFPAS